MTVVFAETYGLRFNRADNANKYAQSADFSKMNSKSSNTQLEDVQRVNVLEKNQDTFDPKEHFEKMFDSGSKNSKLYRKPKAELAADHLKNKHSGHNADCPLCECETCKSRRYQDKSSDNGVSFQKPTKMRPAEAAHRVRAHEMEHVRREQHKANAEGNRIVSQSVRIHTDVCPECGDNFVSGGTTTTRVRYSDPDYIRLFNVGAEDMFRKGDSFTASA